MQTVLLTAGPALYLYHFLRVLWRVGDEGTLVYGAQRVVEGALPYRDFFEVMGPGSFYFLGLFFWLFGTSFPVARVVLLLTGVASVVLIYWMTRRLYQGPGEMLPAIYYLLVSLPLWPATNHHWDSNLFFLLSLAAFFLWLDRGQRFYLVLSGIIAGLTSCFIQQKGLLLFVALAVVLSVQAVRQREAKGRLAMNLSLLAAGYAGVGAAVLLLFSWAGGLPDLIYANLIWPLNNYHNVNVVPYGHGFLELFWPNYQNLWLTFLPAKVGTIVCVVLIAPLALFLVLPAVLGALAVLSLLRAPWRSSIWSMALLPYWTAGFALWLSELHRQDLFHLIYGSPLLLILALVIPSVIWPGRKPWKILVASGLLCYLLFWGIANLLPPVFALTPMETRRGKVYLYKSDDALDFLLHHTRPKEEVFVYPYYPMYYFLADLRNPTRYSILVYYINTEEQFLETINRLESKQVRYVLWDTMVENKTLSNWFPQYWIRAEEDLPLEQYLKKHYRFLGMKNGFRILERQEMIGVPPLGKAAPGGP